MDLSGNSYVPWCVQCFPWFQPPKKKGKKGKGKGKKSAKSKTPTVIDGVSTEEMTKEQVRVIVSTADLS